MELIEWLDAERGRSLALAEHMGKSRAAVTFWRTDGVPLKLMRKVSAFTDGVVSVEGLMRHALACHELRRDAAAAQEG